ncbi:MAG: radical SAM protein [Candidatus Helarchaeota archaeon]
MKFPKLTDNVVIKNIERPALYDILNDDLFELDEEGYRFIKYLTGFNEINTIINNLNISKSEIDDFIKYLIENNLIIDKKDDSFKIYPDPKQIKPPSLRTLLIHLTTICNLKCKHCYLNKEKKDIIPVDVIIKVIKEFTEMQGFKILLSGGEPLLYPHLFKILQEIQDLKIRKILFSNGLKFSDNFVSKIKGLIHEVQISIDGTKSHDDFRNCKGSFNAAINAIKKIKKNDIAISVATMVHRKNLSEFDELKKILEELKVDNWYLDVPCADPQSDFIKEYGVTIEEGASILLNYGWGKVIEDFYSGYACGAHLCAIMANGNVVKCGFFENEPVGNINNESLSDLWNIIQKKYIWKIDNLKCSDLNCPHIKDCYGGCRYRAKVMFGDLMGLDKIKCKIYNFL